MPSTRAKGITHRKFKKQACLPKAVAGEEGRNQASHRLTAKSETTRADADRIATERRMTWDYGQGGVTLLVASVEGSMFP